tara:strand:- start:4771 stop:4956 length:186 start_codon:yes stop_codon:yes gene_type:complete
MEGPHLGIVIFVMSSVIAAELHEMCLPRAGDAHDEAYQAADKEKGRPEGRPQIRMIAGSAI